MSGPASPRPGVLLLGSYNGQDSFGDKCLLNCVADQFRRVYGPEVRVATHVVDLGVDAFPGIDLSLGLSKAFGVWVTKLRHLHLPPPRCTALVGSMLWQLGRLDGATSLILSRVLEDIRRSKLLYFYGGTQMSAQWFDLNFPAVEAMFRLCREEGLPIYMGPQQYGPLDERRTGKLKRLIRRDVRKAAARNEKCLELLGLPPERLFYDEVYSSTERYPVVGDRTAAPEHILLNFRGAEFLDERYYGPSSPLSGFLKIIQAETGLPFRYFCVSGKSFCDDARVYETLRLSDPTLDISMAAPVCNERDLLDLSRRAYGAISMSFHGCVFALMGGAPAVPVSEEGYYDHKYADFSKYAGGQSVPVISPRELDARTDALRVLEYWGSYDTRRTAAARHDAAGRISSWYREVASDAAGLKR